MIDATWLCVFCIVLQDVPPASGGGGEEAILSGPDVRDVDEAKPSLIGGDFSGQMNDVLADPALDALRLIGLNEEQGSKLDEIMADRWSLLDALLREHYGLVVEYSAAATARNRQEIAILLPRVRDTLPD